MEERRAMYFGQEKDGLISRDGLVIEIKNPLYEDGTGDIYFPLSGQFYDRYMFNYYYKVKSEKGNRIEDGDWIEYWYQVEPLFRLRWLESELKNANHEKQVQLLTDELFYYKNNIEYNSEICRIIERGFIKEISVCVNTKTKRIQIIERRERGNKDIITEIIDKMVSQRVEIQGDYFEHRTHDITKRLRELRDREVKKSGEIKDMSIGRLEECKQEEDHRNIRSTTADKEEKIKKKEKRTRSKKEQSEE